MLFIFSIVFKKIYKIFSRSHRIQFLFVKLTWMPLQLLSLLERYFLFWFLYFTLLLKGGFWLVSLKKLLMVTFFMRPKKTVVHIFYCNFRFITMTIYSVYVVNKAGGLIFQYDHQKVNTEMEKTFRYVK